MSPPAQYYSVCEDPTDCSPCVTAHAGLPTLLLSLLRLLTLRCLLPRLPPPPLPVDFILAWRRVVFAAAAAVVLRGTPPPPLCALMPHDATRAHPVSLATAHAALAFAFAGSAVPHLKSRTGARRNETAAVVAAAAAKARAAPSIVSRRVRFARQGG